MRDQRIKEAFEKISPSEERLNENLKRILVRLNEIDMGAPEEKTAINASSQKKEPRLWKRAKWIPAAAVFAVIVLLGIQTEAFAGIRSWFRHFRENDPKTVVYEFNEDSTGKKLPQIIIGWLPEEFEGAEPIDTSNAYRFSRVYVHNNKLIDFTIDYMHKGGKMYIIPEEGEDLILEEMIINGNKAELWYDSMSCSMNIFDDTHGILIEIDSNIEKEQIIRIAENIQFVFE